MGFLKVRSIKIDNIYLQLDTASNEVEIAAEQPKVYIRPTYLPYGIERKEGYVLLKEDTELIQSGGPLRKIIKPCAYAFKGEKTWKQVITPTSLEYCWLSFSLSEWEGILYIPDPIPSKRRAIHAKWVDCNSYGFNGWKPYGDWYPSQYEELLSLSTSGVANNRGIKVITTGDNHKFLTD